MFNRISKSSTAARVILIRHGETEWNAFGKFQGQTDINLSEKGRNQAKKLAEFFPVENLDAIYSSDLSRAFETASFVAKKFNLNVTKEPAFREMNFGLWEGLTYNEINEKWPEELKNFYTRPDLLKVPEGETFVKLQTRAVKRVYELVEKHRGGAFAIFSHGGVLRTILADALEMPLKNIWRIKHENTSVSIVSYGEAPFVECFNNVSHLMK